MILPDYLYFAADLSLNQLDHEINYLLCKMPTLEKFEKKKRALPPLISTLFDALTQKYVFKCHKHTIDLIFKSLSQKEKKDLEHVTISKMVCLKVTKVERKH